MDEIVIRSLQRRATPAEEEELRRWRQHPANEARYRALAKLWEVSDAAAPRPDPQKPSFQTLLARVREEVPPARARPSWRRRAAPAAAALLAASVAGLALYLGGPERASPVGELPFQGEIVTGKGELTTVTLDDGTRLRLGPASRLRIRRDGRDEVAELEGRAFFAVRSDSTRRFRVRTDEGEAVVRGTRFEVRSEGGEFRVLVIDGRVEVAAAGRSVELGEAAMGRVSGGGPLATTRVDDVYGQLAWMGNTLVFQNTPLPRALDEIERRLGVAVALTDPSLGRLTVTATFTDQSVEEVFQVLCGMLGAGCSVEDGRAVVGPVSTPRERAPP